VQWYNTGNRSVIRSDVARGGTDGLRLTAPDFTGNGTRQVAQARLRT